MAKPNLTMLLGLAGKSKSSAPPSFGEDAEPDAMDPMESMEPEAEGESASGDIPPEAVCYRTADQKCEACVYMGQDGTCSKLGMPVEPTASCNLFSAGSEEAEMPAEEEMPMEEEVAS